MGIPLGIPIIYLRPIEPPPLDKTALSLLRNSFSTVSSPAGSVGSDFNANRGMRHGYILYPCALVEQRKERGEVSGKMSRTQPLFVDELIRLFLPFGKGLGLGKRLKRSGRSVFGRKNSGVKQLFFPDRTNSLHAFKLCNRGNFNLQGFA